MDVEEIIDELYGLPPARFTSARDEAAAHAKRAGDRAAAKRIAALRRPTLAAWASNLLVRGKPSEVEQFLQLGQALRAAHRSLNGEELRALSHQQHVVIGALAREALRLTDEAGAPASETVLREVEQILYAVLAGPEAAEAWASGRLVKAPAPVPEFPGIDPGAVPPPGPSQAEQAEQARRAAASRPPAADRRPDPRLEAARTAVREAQQAAAAREEELRQAQAARQRAREQATAAEAEVDRAQAARELAYTAVAEAEEQHRAAGRAAQEAHRAAVTAERRLRDLTEGEAREGGDGAGH
ncbi:hypothetical protein [Streptomyces sp. NPDC002990]